VSHSCSTVGSLAMALMNGRILFEVLKNVELQGHKECLVPVLKVCYSRYCSWFAEIGPAFKLNIGNLVRRCWVGICIK
jgi:hypothetical protein